MISCRRISASLCSTDHARFGLRLIVLPCGSFPLVREVHCLGMLLVGKKMAISLQGSSLQKTQLADLTCKTCCSTDLPWPGLGGWGNGGTYPSLPTGVPHDSRLNIVLPVQRGLEVVGHDHWHTSVRHHILTPDSRSIPWKAPPIRVQTSQQKPMSALWKHQMPSEIKPVRWASPLLVASYSSCCLEASACPFLAALPLYTFLLQC